MGEKIAAALVKVAQDNTDKRLYISTKPHQGTHYAIFIYRDKYNEESTFMNKTILAGYQKRLIGIVMILISKKNEELSFEVVSEGPSEKKYFKKEETRGVIDILSNYMKTHTW